MVSRYRMLLMSWWLIPGLPVQKKYENLWRMYEYGCMQVYSDMRWGCRGRESIIIPLHKKWSFQLKISSVNVTQSALFCVFGHLLKKSLMENFIFCAVIVCIGVSTPLKYHPLFLAKPLPLKSANCHTLPP